MRKRKDFGMESNFRYSSLKELINCHLVFEDVSPPRKTEGMQEYRQLVKEIKNQILQDDNHASTNMLSLSDSHCSCPAYFSQVEKLFRCRTLRNCAYCEFFLSQTKPLSSIDILDVMKLVSYDIFKSSDLLISRELFNKKTHVESNLPKLLGTNNSLPLLSQSVIVSHTNNAQNSLLESHVLETSSKTGSSVDSSACNMHFNGDSSLLGEYLVHKDQAGTTDIESGFNSVACRNSTKKSNKRPRENSDGEQLVDIINALNEIYQSSSADNVTSQENAVTENNVDIENNSTCSEPNSKTVDIGQNNNSSNNESNAGEAVVILGSYGTENDTIYLGQPNTHLIICIQQENQMENVVTMEEDIVMEVISSETCDKDSALCSVGTIYDNTDGSSIGAVNNLIEPMSNTILPNQNQDAETINMDEEYPNEVAISETLMEPVIVVLESNILTETYSNQNDDGKTECLLCSDQFEIDVAMDQTDDQNSLAKEISKTVYSESKETTPIANQIQDVCNCNGNIGTSDDVNIICDINSENEHQLEMMETTPNRTENVSLENLQGKQSTEREVRLCESSSRWHDLNVHGCSVVCRRLEDDINIDRRYLTALKHCKRNLTSQQTNSSHRYKNRMRSCSVVCIKLEDDKSISHFLRNKQRSSGQCSSTAGISKRVGKATSAKHETSWKGFSFTSSLVSDDSDSEFFMTPWRRAKRKKLSLSAKKSDLECELTLDQILEEQREEDLRTKKILAAEDSLLLLEPKVDVPNDGVLLSDDALSCKPLLKPVRIISGPPGLQIFDTAKTFQFFDSTCLELATKMASPGVIQNTLEKKLCSIPVNILCDVIGCQGLELFSFAQLSEQSQNVFLHFLWQVAAVHDTYRVVVSCQRLMHVILGGTEINWCPSVIGVLILLLNFGATESKFPLPLLLNQAQREISEEFPNAHWTSKVVKSSLAFTNLRIVLQILSTLISRKCHYSSDDCTNMVIILCWIALDQQVINNGMVTYISECLKEVLDKISEEQWNNKVDYLCQELVKLDNHHHNLVWIAQCLPPSPRGAQLQRSFSFTAIQKLSSEEPVIICNVSPCDVLKFIHGRRLHATADHYWLYNFFSLVNMTINTKVQLEHRVALHQLANSIMETFGQLRENLKSLEVCYIKSFLVEMRTKWMYLVGISTTGIPNF